MKNEIKEDVGAGMAGGGVDTSIAGTMGQQPITPVGVTNPSKYQKQVKKREKKGQLNYKYQKIRKKKGNVMEGFDTALEILESLVSEAELPDFIEDQNRKKRNDEYIAKMRKEEADKKRAEEDRKKYMKDSIIRFRKSLRESALSESCCAEIERVLEEVIDEKVTVGRYARAAQAVSDKRVKEYEKAYSKKGRENANKELSRASHALHGAKLPVNSAISMKKYKDATKASIEQRENKLDAAWDALHKSERRRKDGRVDHRTKEGRAWDKAWDDKLEAERNLEDPGKSYGRKKNK